MRHTQIVVPKTIASKFSEAYLLFRNPSNISKHRRKIFCSRSYSTSSSTSPKPVTSSVNVSKGTFNQARTASHNFLSFLWRSVAIATSKLQPVSFFPSLTGSQSDNKRKVATGQWRISDFKKFMQIFKPSWKLSHYVNISSKTKHNKYEEKNVESTGLQKTKELVKEKENELEVAFLEWMAGGSLQEKRYEFLQKERKEDKKAVKVTKPVVSKASLESRSRFLVRSLTSASSSGSQLLRLEEACKHLLHYPQEKGTMVKEGLIRIALRLKKDSSDLELQAQARAVLSLLGYHESPRGPGVRILTIDGGGTRGLMAIEILRQLEAKTNRPIYKLFDYICGVSSGAILSFLLGGLRMTLDDCEMLYRKLSWEVFSQSALWGTGRLMWNHAYYDTSMWVDILKNSFGDKLIIDTVMQDSSPKLSAVSAVMNLPVLRPFVFRNYEYPFRVQSQYMGSSSCKLWEAIRASGAAPGYFEEFFLDDLVHQDGGIMMNNPSALAIHEARLLWPKDYIHCVISVGSGRFIPAAKTNLTSTNLKTKILKIIDSATDTEAVHITLNDLLYPGSYFRFNPYLTEFLTLDENRPDKLQQLKTDAQMYLRRNEYKLDEAAKALVKPRGHLKTIKDWLQIQKSTYL